MRSWQLQDAKNKLSEVVDRALEEGPQTITRHGEPAVVVVAHRDWKKRARRRVSDLEYLSSCPKVGLTDKEVDDLFRRDPAPARIVDLG
jgi:prevent-host-death family protein